MKTSKTVGRALQRYMVAHSIERLLDAQYRLASLRSDSDYAQMENERRWEEAKARVRLSHHLKELGELVPYKIFTIRRKA